MNKLITIVLILFSFNLCSQMRLNLWIASGVLSTTIHENHPSKKINFISLPVYGQIGATFGRKFSAGMFFSYGFILNSSSTPSRNINAISEGGFSTNFSILGEQDMGNSLLLKIDFGSFGGKFVTPLFIRPGLTLLKEIFNENFLFITSGYSIPFTQDETSLTLNVKNSIHLMSGIKFTL